MEIITKTTIDAWKKSLKFILDNGVDFEDKDARLCRELMNFVLVIQDPEQDYEKPIDIMQQFEWIYPSKEELSAIILNKEESIGYEYNYGSRIFNYHGLDQINDFIVPLLKKDPSSRRAVISLYDAFSDSKLLSRNIPSLMQLHFKIIENRLNLACFIRSNDFFIGWPGNIYQLVVLQKHVANILNIEIGTITTISGSAHIFHEYLDYIQRVIAR